MLKSYLITFFISMVPIVELRGAIPYGTLLCNPPVPLLQAYIISIIGNMLPVPIIFFFARKVLEWGADKPIIGGFFALVSEKRPQGWCKVTGKSRTRTLCCPAFVRRYPTSGHRRMDRYTGSLFP